MPTDDQSPRIGPFRKVRGWIIGSLADRSPDDSPAPARPAGLDTRLPVALAAELRAADPEGREALQIIFKIGDSIEEEFKAIDPEQARPEVLPRPRRVYYAVNGFEMDVNNGGFEQYYLNSWSDCAHELPGMLRDIGMPELANLVDRANAVFPQGPPADRAVRLAQMGHLGDAASDQWNELDDEFYDRGYACQPHLVRHVLAHEPDFFKA